MKKIFKALFAVILGVFVVGSLSLKADGELVTVDSAASIRTATQQTSQGLRFYAKLDESVKTNEHGFYLVYGKVTVNELQNAILAAGSNDVIVNGKVVFKVPITGVTAENEFSVVLTGIPEEGYFDNISVVAYVVSAGAEQFVEAPATRSIAAVVLSMANAGVNVAEVVENVETILETDSLKFSVNAFGHYEFSSGLYEKNHFVLREEFIKDWNAKFGTTWTTLVGSTFHASAKVGATHTDISNSNIYKFFNDPLYKDKWEFILNIMIAKGETNPKLQSEAIKGNGINAVGLYDTEHLNFSITNFFNQTNVMVGYQPVNFAEEKNYINFLYLIEGVYIDPTNYQFYQEGDTWTLPDAEVILGYDFNHFLFGSEEFDEGDTYLLDGDTLFKAIYTPTVYNITFYDGEDEIEELSITYTIEDSVSLTPYVKAGYKFVNWYSNPQFDGFPTYNIPKGTTGNKVYYAEMEESSYNVVGVTYNLNSGMLSSDDMIEYRPYTYVLATRYITGNESSNTDKIKVGTYTAGKYWPTIGFSATADSEMFLYYGKGDGYVNENCVIYITYFTSAVDGDYAALIKSIRSAITTTGPYSAVVMKGIPASAGAANIDIYFFNKNDMTANLTKNHQLPGEEMIVPVRAGYTFAGWCLQQDLSDTPTLEFPGYTSDSGVNTVNYYAKWIAN